MAEDLFLLTEKDRDILRALIDREKNTLVNARNRPGPESPTNQAPEIYVVSTPASGIPGRSGSTPGSATCAVYRLSQVTGLLEGIDGLLRTVYNLSVIGVSGGEYALASRDKFGRWFLVGKACTGVIVPSTGTTGGGGDLPPMITSTWFSNCLSGCIGTASGTFEMTLNQGGQWQYLGYFTPTGCSSALQLVIFQFVNGSADWYWVLTYGASTIDSGGPMQATSGPPDPLAFPSFAADISGTGGYPCGDVVGSGANINFTAEE